MTKKSAVLSGLAILLGAIYVVYFTNWLHPPAIRIIAQNRMLFYRRRNPRRNPRQVLPITFTLDGTYRLTMIKVVPVAVSATNANLRPVWWLVGKSRSRPLKGFFYGRRIPGMIPRSPQYQPHRLKANHLYHLIVQAGRARGSTDFRPSPGTAVAP